MVRNLVLCVALIAGLNRSGVSALCALCRLCARLTFQAALLEALVLLSGRAQLRNRTTSVARSPRSASVFSSCLRSWAASRFAWRSEFTVVCHLCGGLSVLRVVMAWQTDTHGLQAINRLTLPSSGPLPASFACFQPPLMSNVRPLMRNLVLALLVSALLVAFPAIAAGPKVHRVQATNPLPDGWHLARSTEGGFSVNLPSPFNDFTVADGDDITYVLGAPDSFGSKFVAMFAPAGASKRIAGKFEADLRASHTSVTFRGFPALRERQLHRGSDGEGVANSLRFRTPDGIYVLLIISPKSQEAQSVAVIDRFFNSVQP